MNDVSSTNLRHANLTAAHRCSGGQTLAGDRGNENLTDTYHHWLSIALVFEVSSVPELWVILISDPH